MLISTERGFNYNIFIVGVGATGSQLLPFLTQLLNSCNRAKITLIDRDKVEEKNLRNQKFNLYDLNQNKAQILADRYTAVYPSLKIGYVDDFILDKEQLINLINKDTHSIPVVVSCVDNNASRVIFNEVFNDKRIEELIYIDTGNGTLNREGQTVVGYKYTKRKSSNDGLYMNKKTYKVLKPVCDVFKEILEDDDTIDNLTGCAEVMNEHPQNISTNITSALVVFNILNDLIVHNKIEHNIVFFNVDDMSINSRKIKEESFESRLIESNLMYDLQQRLSTI